MGDIEAAVAPAGGLLGRFDNVQTRPSAKRTVTCDAATPEYLRSDYLKPCHLPVHSVDHEANYSAAPNINETRFHKGFSRRHKSDIQPDAARLEVEVMRDMRREDRERAAVQATLDHRQKCTFNVLTGEGYGRECEFKQVGKRIMNSHGSMPDVFAEHERDSANRMKASKHRFFQYPDPCAAQVDRSQNIFNEGLRHTQRESATIGYGSAGVPRTRTRSCGAPDNYAHLRSLPPEPDWEKPRHANRSQIILG